jgi:signal recognition particle subunit SRP54
MGDVLTLIEKAQQTIDETQIKDVEKKLRQATFDLDDFLQQIQNVKKMGSISQIMDMLPGMGQMGKNMPANVDDSQMQKMEAMIQSMTAEERHHPELINGSRRRRIALGSGTTAQEINLLLNQFKQTQKIMKRFAKTKNPRALMNMFK